MSKFIESLIAPAKASNVNEKHPVRIVNCFGVRYEFAPALKGRFIAEVSDERAIEAMLSKPKLYREVAATELAPGPKAADSTSTVLTKTVKPAEPAKTPEPAKEPPKEPEAKVPPASEGDDKSETANEVTRLAQALLASTPNAIKKQLEKHCPDLAVLKAAYAIELADPKKRDLVASGLKAAIQAKEAE